MEKKQKDKGKKRGKSVNKKGIFVVERNPTSFFEKINHIKENYNDIQQEMKKNKLPTKEEFIKRFSDLISKLN